MVMAIGLAGKCFGGKASWWSVSLWQMNYVIVSGIRSWVLIYTEILSIGLCIRGHYTKLDTTDYDSTVVLKDEEDVVGDWVWVWMWAEREPRDVPQPYHTAYCISKSRR